MLSLSSASSAAQEKETAPMPNARAQPTTSAFFIFLVFEALAAVARGALRLFRLLRLLRLLRLFRLLRFIVPLGPRFMPIFAAIGARQALALLVLELAHLEVHR